MKSSKKSNKKPTYEDSSKGNELGDQQRVMAVSTFGLNQALIDAEVVGCSYGYSPYGKERAATYYITLLGRNESKLREAYEIFKSWGCEEDGDVVSVEAIFNDDGSYDLWIGAEWERFIYRTIPNFDLYDTLSFNASWIKHFDTTSPFLKEIKTHKNNIFSPIVLLAATCPDEVTRNIPPSHIIPVADWKPILKFDLKLLSEAEARKDPKFMHTFMKNKKKRKSKKPKVTPNSLFFRREKTIDGAFPVTKERIIRSNIIETIKNIKGYGLVTEDQIIQAIINLMISKELTGGKYHFIGLGKEYKKDIYKFIGNHTDIADNKNNINEFDTDSIAKQVHLDLLNSFSLTKYRNSNKDFPVLQSVYIKKGFSI